MTRPSDEKQRVASLLARLAAGQEPRSWETPAGHVEVAIPASAGDDCAVLDFSGDVSLVCGSDYVRGAKFALFELGLLNYHDLGYYVVAANLSDVAAMGAQPVGILTVVRYPPELSDADFDAVLEGAREAAGRHGCEVLGGDTGGAERLILSASALGICERGKVLLRSTAQPGDRVCLTGSVGAPAAAILYFAGGRDADQGQLSEGDQRELLSSWRRPEPRIGQGRLLATDGLASACQDVSDGLRTTAEELAAASGIRITIDEQAIPLDASVERVARAGSMDPLALAMSASVDFELLFTVPPSRLEACKKAFAVADFPLYEIGEASEGAGAAMRRQDGSLADLPGVQWRHQQEDAAGLLRNRLRANPVDR
jgi:thiamine-monophosphate kinase